MPGSMKRKLESRLHMSLVELQELVIDREAWCVAKRPGVLQPWGCKESDMTERLHFHSAYKLNKQGDNMQP